MFDPQRRNNSLNRPETAPQRRWVATALLVAAFVLLSLALQPAGPAFATGSAGASPQAGTLTVTILNEDPAQSNHVIAFYDANENMPNLLAGHYVGARVCATGGAVTGVTATLLESVGPDVAFPTYDGNNDENEFELGRNESVLRSLGDLADGECKLAYYYIFVPRFKNGGTEMPQSPALGMTQDFAITAAGTAMALPVTAADSSIVEMDQAISASANKIVSITVLDNGILTITVNFDLGNPGGDNNATFNPTAWVGHDAGLFHLEAVSISLPGQPIANPTKDVLFVNGLTTNNTVGTIVYTLRQVSPGTTTFYPVNVISSGAQDKYNGVIEPTPPVGQDPRLLIEKRLTTPDPTTVGSNVIFEIVVTNDGNTVLTDVDVSDTFDTAWLDFVSATPAQTTVNEGAGTISWNDIEGNAPGGTFDPGETITLTVTFTATAATPDPTKARNCASVAAKNGTVNAGPACDDVDINVPAAPSIQISKQLNSLDPTVIGATVTFDIAVTNNGNTVLTDVDISDNYATAYLDFLSATPVQTAFNEGAGTISWNNIEGNASGGTFDPGDTIHITVRFTATAATPDPTRAQNCASAAAQNGAVTAGPACDDVDINVPPAPAVRITKRLTSVDPAPLGSLVVFEIVVTNAGNTILANVDVSDTFDTQYLQFQSASPAETNVNEGAGTLFWDNVEVGNVPGGSFDPGESITITVIFMAEAVTPNPARARNTASVSAFFGQQEVTAGPATASVRIPSQPTAVNVIRFEAHAEGAGRVTVDWLTASETDILGFYVQRAAQPATGYERVDDRLIPARGGASGGASYVFRDESAPRAPLLYRLEVVSASGGSTFVGTAHVDGTLRTAFTAYIPLAAKR